jgi:hypothetical protein
MGGNKNNKQTTSTGICQMDSKNINNNGNNDNKQPQLGCVKWVAKTSTTTTKTNLNWDA